MALSLKPKRHLSSRSHNNNNYNGGTSHNGGSCHQHKSDFKAIVELLSRPAPSHSPSPTPCAPVLVPKGLIVRPFSHYLGAPRPPSRLLSLLPARCFWPISFWMRIFNFSPHKYTLLLLLLSRTLLCLFFVYILVFLFALFSLLLMLLWVRSQLPSACSACVCVSVCVAPLLVPSMSRLI